MLKKDRIACLGVLAILCMGVLSGCGNTPGSAETATGRQESQAVESQIGESQAVAGQTGRKKSIVCTIFPEYDWAKEIIGELSSQYDVTLLLDNGADLHSYQPTAEDMAKIAGCDIFVYVGGESDTWVEDALREGASQNRKVINLLEVLGDTVKEEEIVEGMEAEQDAEGDDAETRHADGEVTEEGPEYDEHVWLSLKNAKVIVKAMTEALKETDEENEDTFQSNYDAYVEKLDELDQDYAAAVSEGRKDTLLFGDRFPFRYLVDDYHLNYYAAFVGCSAETEASFETIVFLSGKVDELGLSHVMVIENSDKKIAQTIINNTKEKNQNILVLDSMQSTTGKEIGEGKTYLLTMQSNLDVLKTALK